MKRLLIAFILASIVAAILRALAGQRRSGANADAPAASGNGSRHRRDAETPGADVAETIDEAIEVSASELSSTPAATGQDTGESAENN